MAVIRGPARCIAPLASRSARMRLTCWRDPPTRRPSSIWVSRVWTGTGAPAGAGQCGGQQELGDPAGQVDHDQVAGLFVDPTDQRGKAGKQAVPTSGLCRNLKHDGSGDGYQYRGPARSRWRRGAHRR